MPSIVKVSSGLSASPFLALVSHSITEDNNGLLTVNCEYVCSASRITETDAVFYPDAPPPIYPSSIDRRFLLAQRLFMGNRSVSVANGLTKIEATYVAGLARSGKHARVTISVQPLINKFFVTGYNPSGTVALYVQFSYIPTIIEHEYATVGGEKSGNIIAPTNDQLFTIVSAGGAGAFDLTPMAYAERFLNASVRAVDEQSATFAPSVLLKKTKYFVQEYNSSS